MATADAAVNWALQQLGKSYAFGAAGPGSFDCSGLTLKAFEQLGIKLPHKAALQQEYGYEVGLGGAQPGDLVFFSGGPTAITNKNGLNIGHVGIYVGNGYVLEAYSSKDKVRIRQIGNRASSVASVKRLATPVQTTITVPGSAYTPSSGPAAQNFVIKGTSTSVIPGLYPPPVSWGGGGGGAYVPTGPVGSTPGLVGTGSANAAEMSAGLAQGLGPSASSQWSGGALSDDQLVQVLATAGFQGEELVTAFAIAKRESSGNPMAFNPHESTKDLSYGLFQINMRGDLGPARRAAYGLASNDDLYDPLTNARVAYAMAHENQIPFYAWGPYKGMPATYGTNVSQARAAVQNAIVSGSINVPWAPNADGGPVTYVDAAASGPEAAAKTANEDPAVTARRLFGYMAAYLDDPEIGPLLVQAAAEQADEATLMGLLFNQIGPDGTIESNWWHRTQASAREWDANASLDPATAESKISAKAQAMFKEAQGMGVSLSPDRLRAMALESLRMGWDPNQEAQAIGAEILRDPNLISAVTAGQAGRRVSDTAFNYGVPLSEEAKRQWSSQIAAGQMTNDDFTKYVINQAKGQFNSADLSAAMDRGVTVRQYADPYITLASNTLGLNADDIDLTDPKWMRSIAYVDDKGLRRPMNLDEWGRTLRRDPVYGYGTTDNAKAQAFNTAAALGRIFGQL